MATTEEYVNRIHQSLHPRWQYAGGWIIAEVSNDPGMAVTLLGYKDPVAQERELFISKVKASVDDESPKIYWQRIGTSDRVELLSLEEVAQKEAKEDIQRLIKFAEDTRKAIENKAAQDNQKVRALFEDTKRAIEQNISDVDKSLEDIQRQAYQLLDRASRGVGQVVEPLEQTVTESWNQYWLARIFESISSGVNLDNAKNVVRKLQQAHLQEQPSQIIDRLIDEKAILATVVGLSSEAVNSSSGESASLATLTSDLYSITSLLAEMCYQIAVAYEVEDLHYSARKGEILTIFALALASDRLVRLDLDFLLQNTPIASWLINAGTNVIVFQVVGYAAREFYKAKVKEKINPLASSAKFTQLETEIKFYLESVISEKETIEQQVVAEAVRISRDLERIDTSDRKEEAEKEAKEDIQGLVKFAEDTWKAIQNKAIQDIRIVQDSVNAATIVIGQNMEAAGRAAEDTKRQAYQLLELAALGVGQVVEPVVQTVTESWNEYWLDRIFDAITKLVDLDKTKDKVRELQQKYPQEQPSQIIDRLIKEKALFAIVVGLGTEAVAKLGSGLASLGTLTIDLVSTTSLLVELCYQIAVAYGFEDLQDPARKGEILAIFGLALGGDRLNQLGLGFLLKHSPIPSWLINASTNVIVFQVVGYAASEFYKAKEKNVNPVASKAKFSQLETEIKSYLELVISEKETIEQHVVAEAVRIKAQLPS